MNDAPLFRSKAGMGFLLVAGLLLVLGLTQSASQPTPTEGPEGSSFATSAAGTAALVDLLVANDYEVVRERRPLEERPPPAEDVLVIVNGSSLSAADELAVFDYVSTGGRLVAIGSTRLDGLAASPPGPRGMSTETSSGVLPVSGYDSVSRVESRRVWPDAGSLVPVVGNAEGTAVGIEYVGEGVVIAIADDTVISNQLLSVGDHALLALLAVGEPDGAVRFVEYIHGFTQPTGLTALPTRWKQALIILAVAGIVWLAARGHRFAPAERTSRGLAPPRSAYVDALAFTLLGSKDPDAAGSLDTAVRTELARRGADPGSPESMIQTAVQGGIDEDLAKTAFGPGAGRHEAQARAKVLSRLVNKEQL
ncbi:MAG: DUF4350 domain-containing protein [Acidimicrobiia bacterium]|nr:DUF4350 domain-containing protein [Acidimicrobiia bacterium]